MKPVHIDLLVSPRTTRAPRVLLALVVTMGLTLAAWNVWQWQDLQMLRHQTQAMATAAAARASTPEPPAPTPTPAQARALAALGWDWNRLYAPLEQLVDVPGARLLSLEFDALGAQGRVELLLIDVTAIVAVTEVLNASPSTGTWTLDAIQRQEAGASPAGFRVVWRGRFD